MKDEKEQYLEVLERAVKSSPADQTEAVLFVDDTALTRFANSYIHQNIALKDRKLWVRAIKGKSTGTASTHLLDPDSVARAIETASEIAEHQREDPDFRSLPEEQPYRKVESLVQATKDCSPEKRASGVGKAIDILKKENLTAAGFHSTNHHLLSVVNSLGVRASHEYTTASFNITAMSEDSAGNASAASGDVDEIDPEALARTASEKALMGRHPSELEPGEYTVVLEEPAVASLVQYLGWMGFGGLAYQEGRSFMCGRIGEKITGENITISDDSYHPIAIGLPFDFEGVPRQRVALIERGVARGVVYDSYTAGKEGGSSTGHALPPPNPQGPFPLHLVLEEGESTREELVKSTKKGILVTRFWYTRMVNPDTTLITGMTRDGTFLIEDGVIKGGVKNLRFTQNILEALSRVELISEESKLVSDGFVSSVVPMLKIAKFNFTGKTEF